MAVDVASVVIVGATVELRLLMRLADQKVLVSYDDDTEMMRLRFKMGRAMMQQR